MLRVALAVSFGLAAAIALPAQLVTEVATQMAGRTSSLLPRRATVSLELQNLSSLPAAEWSTLRTQFQDQLRKAGIEIAPASSDPRVRLTLAENARGLLLVGEVVSGDNRQIAMLPWNPPPSEARPRVAVTKKFLLGQQESILDVLLLDSNTQMLLLSLTKVESYRLSGDKWTPVATTSLVLPRPLPRDPRGRIQVSPDGFRAYMPGATCNGTLQPDLKITACAPVNEDWTDAPIHWVTDRNLLVSDDIKTPFFATANGLFTRPDGHVVNRAGQAIAGSEGWGDDIAPVDDACGGNIAVLASSPTAGHDEVRAYTAQGAPGSDALSLPGAVTALWPAETRGQVTLVVRNAQTGEYEASRLGLACSQ